MIKPKALTSKHFPTKNVPSDSEKGYARAVSDSSLTREDLAELAFRALNPSRPNENEEASYTPLETQVISIRQQHPDCMLLVECGCD